MSGRFLQGLLIVLVAGIVGCGGVDDMPEIGHVQGRITFNGDPLPNARIEFNPLDGGRGASAETDADGAYELNYIRDEMGAKVGKNSVTIETAIDAEEDDNGKIVVPAVKEKLPARYNEETELTFDVQPGENEANFDLTSK